MRGSIVGAGAFQVKAKGFIGDGRTWLSKCSLGLQRLYTTVGCSISYSEHECVHESTHAPQVTSGYYVEASGTTTGGSRLFSSEMFLPLSASQGKRSVAWLWSGRSVFAHRSECIPGTEGLELRALKSLGTFGP
jgi:hypothetical protein